MTFLANQLQQSRLTALSSRLYVATQLDRFTQLSFAHVNSSLLEQLGIDKQAFACEDNLSRLSEEPRLNPLQPISTVYAGHQFGIYTSRLGDGRVHILGDISTRDGARWEVQLKGAGATPFARGNTGRMSLAEAITEYLGCEAVAGLGIAGTRGLALINHSQNTAGTKAHESIFVRTAHSHLRFGHFEYLHNQGDLPLLKELADHVIEHHYPEVLSLDHNTRYLQFLYAVTQRTARLLAQWQSVGFVHSVMNTDNMSILGLTIDYGVYGFMEVYDPAYSPNENDDQNRYAFNQQVDVARWNCLALAESLSELLPGKRIPAMLLRLYRKTYSDTYQSLMRKKLGLSESCPDDGVLISRLLELLHQHHVDYTRFFRRFSHVADGGVKIITDEIDSPNWQGTFGEWFESYRQRLTLEATQSNEREAIMLAHNPRYILRQHLLDDVILRAEQAQDFKSLHKLLFVLQSPYAEHDMHEQLA